MDTGVFGAHGANAARTAIKANRREQDCAFIDPTQDQSKRFLARATTYISSRATLASRVFVSNSYYILISIILILLALWYREIPPKSQTRFYLLGKLKLSSFKSTGTILFITANQDALHYSLANSLDRQFHLF